MLTGSKKPLLISLIGMVNAMVYATAVELHSLFLV